MNDLEPSFDEFNTNALSDGDMAILQAFEAMDSWPPPDRSTPITSTLSASTSPAAPSARITSVLALDQEMLSIFLEEAREDLAHMRQAVCQIEQSRVTSSAFFAPLQSAGHKLRGTAGAVDFPFTSLIAGQIEDIAERATCNCLSPSTALLALSSAITALEHCLQQITTDGQEPAEGDVLLAALAATYHDLGIDLSTPLPGEPLTPAPLSDLLNQLPTANVETLPEELADAQDSPTMTVHIPAHASHTSPENPALIPTVRVDARRLDKLTVQSAYLIEQRNILENAFQQVDIALQEFQTTRSRLQQLEPLLSVFQTDSDTTSASAGTTPSPSSLIARILSELSLRHASYPYAFKNAPLGASASRSFACKEISPHPRTPRSSLDTGTHRTRTGVWDEMDMKRYNEKDKLLNSLREVIYDLNITSARLQSSYAHFATLQQEYLARISSLRRDTLSIRQAPFSTLVPRLARVITMSALNHPVRFDVKGDSIEFDQEILEKLASPLIQLLRTCVADSLMREYSPDTPEEQSGKLPRIWLSIRESGSEVSLEIGFSITIQGGAVAPLRAALQDLGGHLSLRRNSAGGVSFLLHIPRALGTTRCLLLYCGNQQLAVPFSQVQRVLDELQDAPTLPSTTYRLNEMLGFSIATPPLRETSAHPVLMVAFDDPHQMVGVAVDQVIDQVELIIKPLKPYLRRPGIPGAAVDGKGHIVLLVDLPALIEQHTQGLSHTTSAPVSPSNRHSHKARILVADDATYLRHSVRQTLQYEHYTVIEARDGLEALERLQETFLNLCLLDIEMPNLNGYDVLSTIRSTPALAHLKVVMLTSRSSERHRLHALELGADEYLTKPCPQELLLTTVRRLLSS